MGNKGNVIAWVVAPLLILLAGCALSTTPGVAQPASRFDIVSEERLQTLDFPPKSVWVIRDMQTGQEYLLIHTDRSVGLTPLLKKGE